MKKIVFPMILGLALLVGCQNSEPKAKEVPKQTNEENKQAAETTNTNFPYPNLLSEDAQFFSLLVIGEPDQDNPIEKNKKITDKVHDILSLPELEMVKKAYPELNIKSEPAYIVFDQAGVVHQSADLEELTTFLEKK
ncbi:hypothetical protein V7124_02120 [Neobacillus niacini]|uniref:hypothetical protein n=1 Tax=Neobacillus niacini TaxID=86668 RepID=UPI003000B670